MYTLYEEEGLRAMKVEPRMKSIKLTQSLVQGAVGNMDTVNSNQMKPVLLMRKQFDGPLLE